MSGSQRVIPSVRRGTAGAAVGVLVAALLAVLSVSTPAHAADVIAFRAGASAAANQITHRVTIPTEVRETDALLLFVCDRIVAGWAR